MKRYSGEIKSKSTYYVSGAHVYVGICVKNLPVGIGCGVHLPNLRQCVCNVKVLCVGVCMCV